MSNVIGMDDYLIGHLSEPARYVLERGADLFVGDYKRKGYSGPLSDAPPEWLGRVKSILGALNDQFGHDYASGVTTFLYDVEGCCQVALTISGSYLDAMDIPRLPESFDLDMTDDGCVIGASISYLDDFHLLESGA